VLSALQIAEAVRDAIPRVAGSLRPDALDALKLAAARERSDRGRTVLEQLLANAEIAQRDSVPLCQDTGTVWVRVELGVQECLCGDLQSEIDAAVAVAYRGAKLRMSVVKNALFDRTNTDTNTPAFVEVVPAAQPGTGAVVHLMLKGGGSDNASRVEMLPPSAGIEGVRRVVLETVEAGATGACPPLFVGVGVGATFDRVAGLAKRALLRPIGTDPVGPSIASLEATLLAAINDTGIGPAGLGGDTTALAVHVLTAPCHIATLPVAVNLGCSAVRSATFRVGE
jgi:tartrate/fumarate subfamily iron-sulfur-dependent hydro-lyase alpha chain